MAFYPVYPPRRSGLVSISSRFEGFERDTLCFLGANGEGFFSELKFMLNFSTMPYIDQDIFGYRECI